MEAAIIFPYYKLFFHKHTKMIPRRGHVHMLINHIGSQSRSGNTKQKLFFHKFSVFFNSGKYALQARGK